SCRSYAVRAGDTLRDVIPVGNAHRVRVDGPNGFMREFVSIENAEAPSRDVSIAVVYANGSAGDLELRVSNPSNIACVVTVRDESYGSAPRTMSLAPSEHASVELPTAN